MRLQSVLGSRVDALSPTSHFTRLIDQHKFARNCKFAPLMLALRKDMRIVVRKSPPPPPTPQRVPLDIVPGISGGPAGGPSPKPSRRPPTSPNSDGPRPQPPALFRPCQVLPVGLRR